jgi:hypothetical protein
MEAMDCMSSVLLKEKQRHAVANGRSITHIGADLSLAGCFVNRAWREFLHWRNSRNVVVDLALSSTFAVESANEKGCG